MNTPETFKTANPQTWVIDRDGHRAWLWTDPANYVRLSDPDGWKSRMIASGHTIVDDRGQPCGNVWD